DLGGEVGGHGIHADGEILPSAGNAFDASLSAEFSVGSDFAGDAGDFGGKRAELIDHRVNGCGGAKEFALERAAVDFESDGLGKIAFGDCADDAGHFASGSREIGDESVDVFGLSTPSSFDLSDVHAIPD